jgi:hypothetical protein
MPLPNANGLDRAAGAGAVVTAVDSLALSAVLPNVKREGALSEAGLPNENPAPAGLGSSAGFAPNVKGASFWNKVCESVWGLNSSTVLCSI